MKPREILVGSGVFLVLAILLATWVLRKDSKADAIASSRNLQQWGIALNLYLIDNKNQLPATGEIPVAPNQRQAWYNALPIYITEKPLADLPLRERPRPGEESLWIDPATTPVTNWDPDAFYFCYAMNQALQPAKDTRSFKIYELEYPGRVVFLAEVDGFDPACTPDTVAYRHGSKAQPEANILFCDGHVALVPRSILTEDPATRLASSAESGISWFEE
jgi:prepilin-type processing-associated H-X9-DG protein